MKQRGTHGTVKPLMVTPLLPKVFPLGALEGKPLAHKRIYAVFQPMEVDDLRGRLTSDENQALMMELAPTLCYNINCNFSFMRCDGPHSRKSFLYCYC
jgi:hypothetical protein